MGKQVLKMGDAEKLKRVVRTLWTLMTKEEQENTQRVRMDIPFYKV